MGAKQEKKEFWRVAALYFLCTGGDTLVGEFTAFKEDDRSARMNSLYVWEVKAQHG